MTRKGSAFAGVSVALITPFKDDEVDVESLRKQVEFQVNAGTTCLCPVGTTGESPTLSHSEHERVISEVVQAAAGRIKVMAGTGSNSTTEALRLTRWAAHEGADAALMVAPYYNKPTQNGFYQHYRVVAEEVGIPICVYNIPGRTGKNIEPETIARLSELENITMVKEATGSLDQASQILCTTNLTILSGDDSLTLPLLAVGGEGVISVVGNIGAAGHDRVGGGVSGGRYSKSSELPQPLVSTLPRHAGAGHQPDSHQGRDENAWSRHRPAASSDDSLDGAGRRSLAEDLDQLRTLIGLPASRREFGPRSPLQRSYARFAGSSWFFSCHAYWCSVNMVH